MNDTESNRIPGPPCITEPQHSKRGRKPAQESRSVEIRQRIAEWKSVPRAQRKPLTELARELGISHQLASHYASQVPWPDPFAEMAARTAEDLPKIFKMVMGETEKLVRAGRKLSRDDLRFLRKAAKAGNKKAQALLDELEGSSRRD